jgi:hypothetical protein
MLDHYVRAFRVGDIQHHKNAQRAWVKDMGPPGISCFTGASGSCFTRVTCATGRNVQILVGREEVISLLALLGHKYEY